jgi:RNA polymerase sigma-70 factor (ECF subfamily)
MAGRLRLTMLFFVKAVDVYPVADEELVSRVSAGCYEALVPLQERYVSMLTSLVARQVDRASAEEIVQDVFVTVWRHAGDFDARRGGFRAWVFQIARRRIINELRRRRARPNSEPDPEGGLLNNLRDNAPDLDEQVAGAERSCIVRAALRVLSQPQREAVAMAFLEDLTHEEVSNVLRVPLGTTKTRIRSGLRKLRVELTSLGVAI